MPMSSIIIFRELEVMMNLDEQSSNQLFEVLADWEAQLPELDFDGEEFSL